MTHHQYLDEPAETVDWALEFAQLEAEMEHDAIERAKKAK